ncbi:MAG: hypothetical protein QGI29_00495, partial [Pirellulales bacterium]|nr:hypothetical protein [Pirellulales bacterium]
MGRIAWSALEINQPNVGFKAVLETLFQYRENLPRSFTLLASQKGGQSSEITGVARDNVSIILRTVGQDVLATLIAPTLVIRALPCKTA